MAEVKEGIEEVEFFGKVDRNQKGEIASHVPAWTLDQHKEELQQTIEDTERMLSRGLIPDTEKELTRDRVSKMKKKMEVIEESKPQFSDSQKDSIDKARKSLGKKIGDAMFTRTDMMKGTADAHEEARRMADPCIDLRGDEVVLAQKSGCKIDDKGRISRTDAERIWKFCSKSIGEATNTETLRKNV